LGLALLHLNRPASNIINYMSLVGTEEQKDIECNKVPKPEWIDIHTGFDDSSPVAGQLLVSAVVGRSDILFKSEKADL
jgi:hypothetical protein